MVILNGFKCPFSLSNSPVVLQRAINKMLSPWGGAGIYGLFTNFHENTGRPCTVGEGVTAGG